MLQVVFHTGAAQCKEHGHFAENPTTLLYKKKWSADKSLLFCRVLFNEQRQLEQSSETQSFLQLFTIKTVACFSSGFECEAEAAAAAAGNLVFALAVTYNSSNLATWKWTLNNDTNEMKLKTL